MKKDKSAPNKRGRKPLTEEKKEAVTVYVKKTSIQHHGGKNALKSILTKVAESNVILDGPAAPPSSEATTQKKTSTKEVAASPQPSLEKPTEFDKKRVLGRIKELEDALKSPPSNPTIGLTYWKRIRQTELDDLKKQL